jgi:hypothetical protein
MTQRSNVRPFVVPLTELDAREILAKTLLRLCSEHGPKRVGGSIGGADEKTVRNARDEKSTLRIDYAANLLAIDGTALDGFLERVGRRSVPISAVCDTDSDRARESSVLKAALALSVALSDDDEISPTEVRDNRQILEEARCSLDQLLAKLVRVA